VTRTDVSFESAGTRCSAWLYRPDAEAPVPCVVLAHGFSGVREQRLDAFAERFAAAGLAALVFDYRHFGASDGEPRQLLDVGRQLADWQAAIAYARTLDGVDPERVAIWGSSFSGGHVIATAARDSRVAAVISQAPFIDGLLQLRSFPPLHVLRLTAAGLRDELRAVRGAPPYVIKSTGAPGSLAVMTSPDADPGFRALGPPGFVWNDVVAARICTRVAMYRPGRHAKDVHCPWLVCVADKDQVTPPSLALAAAQRAPRAEVLRYPIGHFEIYLGEPFERAVADQTAFLSRHLLGQTGPAGAAGTAGTAATAPARTAAP
jgi:dienelactone hydrolase